MLLYLNLPLADINQYIEHGDIYGGMIPKVLDAKNAIKMAVLKLSLHRKQAKYYRSYLQ